MSAASDFADAVAADDVARIVSAVGAWADELRGGSGDVFELASELPPLALHRRAEVRQAVADASDLFSTSLFDHVAARLADDVDQYVRTAIARAAKRRAARAVKRVKGDEEARLLEEALGKIEDRETRRLAERAARRSSEYFVQRLHHEASKLLVPIEVALARLRSEASQPEVDRAALVRDSEAATERLRYLRAIVDRAREATRTVTPRLREERLAAIVGEARSHLVDRLGERGSRLDFPIDVDPALVMRVDRAALLQALQNLLQNAAEAHAADAPRIGLSVTARTLRMGSEVEIVVADRGAGMTKEQRAALFVPFGSTKPGGTGLGLLVARKMIEEVHGGAMDIQSARGEGTTVRIVMPVGS